MNPGLPSHPGGSVLRSQGIQVGTSLGEEKGKARTWLQWLMATLGEGQQEEGAQKAGSRGHEWVRARAVSPRLF